MANGRSRSDSTCRNNVKEACYLLDNLYMQTRIECSRHSPLCACMGTKLTHSGEGLEPRLNRMPISAHLVQDEAWPVVHGRVREHEPVPPEPELALNPVCEGTASAADVVACGMKGPLKVTSSSLS